MPCQVTLSHGRSGDRGSMVTSHQIPPLCSHHPSLGACGVSVCGVLSSLRWAAGEVDPWELNRVHGGEVPLHAVMWLKAPTECCEVLGLEVKLQNKSRFHIQS